MPVNIRRAQPGEAAQLTAISFAAKRHWPYPEHYYDVWREELTITEDYICANTVFVAETQEKPVGYCAIVEVPQDFVAGQVPVHKGHWLEHIFVRPGAMYQGVGTLLMQAAAEYCRDNAIAQLSIFSDPNAAGFYRKLGAVHRGEHPSSIQGRTVDVFDYPIQL